MDSGFQEPFVTIMCRNDELSWLYTNTFRATRCMKVKRMGITEILRRIWLFSANKIKSSETFSKQPTHLIIGLNSSLRHISVTHILNCFSYLLTKENRTNTIVAWPWMMVCLRWDLQVCFNKGFVCFCFSSDKSLQPLNLFG